MTEDEEARRDELAARAHELRREVGELRQSVDQLHTRTERAEKISSRAVVGVGLMFVVMVLLGWVALAQQQTAEQLESLTQRTLCPVFSLFVGGYDPSTREAGPDRERYEEAFAAFRMAYAELRCITPLVPPRTDG